MVSNSLNIYLKRSWWSCRASPSTGYWNPCWSKYRGLFFIMKKVH